MSPSLPGLAASDLEARPGTPPTCSSRGLEALVDRYDAFIRRTASRHGLTGPEIDEVVQDLRIRIWRATAAGGVRSTNARYVYRVAVSASLDVLRRGRTRAARAVCLEQADPKALGALGAAEERLDLVDLAAAVEASLARLEPARRAAVRLYLRGFDRFEIAELAGWSEGRARNLLYRGLADLRRQLRSRGIADPAPGSGPSARRGGSPPDPEPGRGRRPQGQGIPAFTQACTAACQA